MFLKDPEYRIQDSTEWEGVKSFFLKGSEDRIQNGRGSNTFGCKWFLVQNTEWDSVQNLLKTKVFGHLTFCMLYHRPKTF